MKSGSFKKIIRIWVFLGLCFTAWLLYSMQAHGVDEDDLKSDTQVSVRDMDDFIHFSPAKNSPEVLMFYPGALVAPEAYVPLCHKLAENGIETYLIKMPWRQAKYGYKKIKDLGLLKDKNKKYLLAGHSQGAKMVAQFVHENPGQIDKAILLATTHPRDIDISNTTTKMLKIYGDRDGVADEKDVIANKNKLPVSTHFVKIEGANHSQFGYYGFQLGDRSSGIPREQQQQITLSTMLQFIQK
ncbi:alpha/beta hydrolase [Dyadobacter sp. CY312]|uniref:alpha/beta hydrolase n=1 Tax=Dyadobacter sp. CY312 TaxID=2907303 RepID=UPI001F2F452D|nr:alpha/beta hydrolase [Dyadobacter sp. CY312]MCE7039431.1 alpha/beta hydrolase [Dyadobacter sp. CY312]